MKKFAISATILLLPESAWAAPVMDVRPLVGIVWMFTAICIGIILIKAALNSRSFKGWLGESKVRRVVRAQLDEELYRQLHDVTLPTSDGTAQIDHIIVSIYGIFVIETKNMGGWIFGNPSRPKWTQTLGRSKNSFQNPLRQNYKHIKELDALLQIGEDKLFSVVVFAGDAELKTNMPDNVIRSGGLARYVRTKDAPLLTESEVQRILLKINGAMLERSRTTSREHIFNLNRKFGFSVDEMYRKKKTKSDDNERCNGNYDCRELRPKHTQIHYASTRFDRKTYDIQSCTAKSYCFSAPRCSQSKENFPLR